MLVLITEQLKDQWDNCMEHTRKAGHIFASYPVVESYTSCLPGTLLVGMCSAGTC